MKNKHFQWNEKTSQENTEHSNQVKKNEKKSIWKILQKSGFFTLKWNWTIRNIQVYHENSQCEIDKSEKKKLNPFVFGCLRNTYHTN